MAQKPIAPSKPDAPDDAALIEEMVAALVESYHSDGRTQHLDATFLPSRARTVEIIETLRRLVFPGFFDEHRVTSANVTYHVGELLSHVHGLLYDQVRQALRYKLNRESGDGRGGDACENCDAEAAAITATFLRGLPDLRAELAEDVQAAFDGDPAASHPDETIFCYPGVDAVFIHRVAHRLYQLEVPMLPRIMSEYAHNETGIDIHPGATIGRSFFIDHGTGVVIGETVEIGDRVKIYQGVTLGALSTKGGQIWRGRKRHPTIEDDVTIYGGAIILGGSTTIGRGATIGGSVFITNSIPEGCTVSGAGSEIKITPPKQRKKA